MKHQKKFILAVVFAICLFGITACKKEETKNLTPPFWERLEGYWKFEPTYTLNGDVFNLPEYDLQGTYFKFEETEASPNIWNGQKYVEVSGKNDCLFSIFNEQGLYIDRSSNETVILSKILDYFSFLKGDQLHEGGWGCSESIEIEFNGGGWSFTDLYTKTGFNSIIFFANTDFCGQVGVDNTKEECLEQLSHLQEQEIDRTQIGWGTQKGKIEYKSITANEIQLSIRIPYFGRIVNGVTVLDEVQFTIKKINISDVVSVPSFDLANYQIKERIKFDQNIATVWLNGGALITDNGIDNKCLEIKGGSSYAELEQSVKPSQPPVSFSIWIKPNRVNKQTQIIYAKYKNQYGPIIVSLKNDVVSIKINDGAGNLSEILSSSKIESNKWSHLCFTVDGNNLMKLYVNGKTDSEKTMNSITNDATAKILIGTTEEALIQGIDNGFEGFIDELIIFNNVLNPYEVQQLNVWHLTN